MAEAIAIKPINGTALEICKIIHGYLTKTGKQWALIDQQWMLRCLDDWYGHKIERSVLCYNLKHLVAAGYLNRVTRHRRNPETGKFEPRVTLYKMTMKLRAVFLRFATYFRGIGWRNHITAPVKRRIEDARRAKEAAANAAADALGIRSRADCSAYLRGLFARRT